MGLFKVLIFTFKILSRLLKKTYISNHILIKQVWWEETIILIKDVEIWVDKKLLKNPMKKKVFLPKDQSSKIGLYTKWKG